MTRCTDLWRGAEDAPVEIKSLMLNDALHRSPLLLLLCVLGLAWHSCPEDGPVELQSYVDTVSEL